MIINTEIQTKDKETKKVYRKGKIRRRKKSQRADVHKYNTLVEEAENLGIENITFDHDFSYYKKKQIFKEYNKRCKRNEKIKNSTF